MRIRLMVLLLLMPGSVAAAPAPAPKPPVPNKDDVQAKGQTVILGTWTWKVEGNKLERGGDVFWQQVSNTERNLVPQGGAGWALFKDRAFDKVGLAELKKADYSKEKLLGSSLTPGAVVGLRTRNGKFAKLKIVRYRELHDINFPEAKYLPPAWIRFAQGRPNVKEYHLEINWVLYRGEK